MSRPHDGHQNFFPFGNPFRMIFPKGSNLSPKLLGLLKSFEETLADRLKKLKLENKGDIVSLSWMKLAMELLSETHTDIKTLVTELQFPVSDWDEKWMDVYLDGSVKLLDVCIAFSSQLSQIKQSQLLLQCVIHGLDNSGAFPSREQLLHARSSLDEWMKQVNLRNPKLENCSSILHAFSESLHLAKVKNSAKGKVLMHAMYGVKFVTMFVCSVFAAAFSGSAKALEFNVSDKFLWEEAFNDLQADVNGVMRSLFSNGSLTVLKEMEAVEVRVKKLYSMIGDGTGPVDAETLQNSVSDLKKSSERLSQGLDLLSREIEGFFQIVLTGRDALLCNLRVCSADCDLEQDSNVEEQVVR